VESSGAGRSVVLVYHRVVAGQRDPFELCVTPDRFAEHLDRVRTQAAVVALEDLLTPAPGPRVAITIDDGYADVLTDALPVLEATDTPATVFVSTDTLEDGRVFWWDRLAALVYRAPMTRSGREIDVGGTPIRLRLWHRRSRFETIAALHRALQELPPATIDAHLDELEREIGDGTATIVGTDSGYRIAPRLDADGVRALAASPYIEIGAHTRTHPWLASLSTDEQRAEIEAGRDGLRAALGTVATTFAYPYGRAASYDDTTPSLVADAGFESAWTTERGPIGEHADRFQLPRCSVGTRSADALDDALREWLA
jgi:peptidoglycan/xylan/chitin deacetylase (PgdA/CDA1 family)